MRNSIAIVLLIFVTACTGKKGGENASHKENVRLEQFIVEGQQLYKIHCANCHQTNGEGLAQLFPPLAKSDYMAANFEESICIIKNGKSGEITVNGVTYNQPMPGVATLTNLEIAEIATYIYNSWGSEKGLITTAEVEEILANCVQ